jgi:uncharacterized protein (DUF2147 family)
MRTLLIGVAANLLLLGTALPAGKPGAGDAILGKWWFPKRNGQMEITRSEGAYVGKVVAYDDPDAKDDHNPDPKLRERPFVGITMLADFTYDPKKEKWVDGTIYDGESGKTYKCTMWFENGDLNKLNARGYIGVPLLGRTEVFQRVTPEEEKLALEKNREKTDDNRQTEK